MNQYWSRSEAVLVSYSYHYWSECEPLLVNSPTSSGYFSSLIAILIAPSHRISLYPRQIAPEKAYTFGRKALSLYIYILESRQSKEL